MLVFILLLKVMWILAAEDGQHWTYEGESRTQGLPTPLPPRDLFTWWEDLRHVGGEASFSFSL